MECLSSSHLHLWLEVGYHTQRNNIPDPSRGHLGCGYKDKQEVKNNPGVEKLQ